MSARTIRKATVSSLDPHDARRIERTRSRDGSGPSRPYGLRLGSTAGIGLAIASGLAGAGAQVIVNGRTQARVDHAIEAIRGDVAGANGWASPRTLRPRQARTPSSRRILRSTYW
jgi:hypothetical protein